MKQKEVEDVFGGKEEFANADSMASQYPWCLPNMVLWNIIRVGLIGWRVLTTPVLQLNVRRKAAMATVHTFSSCRFGVRTNR